MRKNKLKKLSKIIQLSEEDSFRSISNPDSVSGRAAGAKKAIKKKTGGKGNDQQANGADIAKKMNFDIEPHRSVKDGNSSLSMMDLIYAVWKSEK